MPLVRPYASNDHRGPILDYVEAMIATAGVGGLSRVIDISKPPYNAVANDPTVNNRVAIQAALDSGQGAPTLIFIPTGTFYVWPAPANDVYPGNDCLRLNYSNVRILGAGMKLSTISCLVAGGLDPNTNWEVVHIGATPYLWRGHGLSLVGNNIANIHVSHLRLTGNSPRNLTKYPVWGPTAQIGAAFPASLVDGENWDTTNKGVFVGNGTARTNIVFEECEVDSFRGEIFYYGGGGGLGEPTNIVVRKCIVHDCVGSILSCSNGLTYEKNEIYHGLNAIEDTPLNDTQIISGNYIHDVSLGITIPSNAAGPANGQGRVIIEHNRVVRAWGWGSYFQGALKGIWMHDNEFVDCPGGYAAMLSGGAGVGGVGPEITIERNVIRLERTDLPGGYHTVKSFQVNSDLGYPGRVIMIGNRTERSKAAVDAGYTIAPPVFDTYDPGTTFDVHGNDWSGGDPSYGPGVDVPGNAYWVNGTTPDNVSGLVFNGAERLVLAPAGVKAVNSFSGAPYDRLITVRVNGNVTINNSATVKLTGGAAFAPGGNGGVITFMRPGGSAAIYEISRFTL